MNNEQQETIDLLLTTTKNSSDQNLKLKSGNKTDEKHKKCPVSGCEGLGNTRSSAKTHRTIASCPMKRQLNNKQKKQRIFLKPSIHLDRFFEKNNENSELKSTIENLRQENLKLRTQLTHSV